MRRARSLLLASLPLSVLVACGGGGDGSGTTEPPVETPTSVVKVQGDNASGEVASRLTPDPTVEVRGQSGTPLSGVEVSFAVSSGGGSVSPSSTTTDANGRASATWTLGTAAGASQVLRAAAGPASTTFSAQAEPGSPDTFEKLEGDNQAAVPGKVLPAPLAVRVADRFDNGIPGIAIEFDPSAGSVSPAQATTDSDGEARTTLTLPESEGEVTVTATGPGLGAVEFGATSATVLLSVATSSLERARATLEYDQALEATGGSESGYAWAVTQGALPSGLSLSPDGSLAGTPSGTGDFDFTVQVQDSNGGTASKALTLKVCEEPVDLLGGESVVVGAPPPSECGVFLPSGGSSDRYRVAVVWPSNSTRDDTEEVTLTVNGVGVSAQAVAASSRRSPAGGPSFRLPDIGLDRQLEGLRLRAAAHRRMLEANEAVARRIGRQALLPDLGRSPRRLTGARAARADSPDTLTIREVKSTSCTIGDQEMVDAVLLRENDHAAIYQTAAEHESNPVDSTSVQEMLDYYDAYGKQVIDDWFGGISDVDGNGKFYAVVAPVDPSIGEDAAAFVLVRDLLEPAECPASNQAEITYFGRGIIEALTEEKSFQALGTLVHEAKHISSLYNRVEYGAFHASWIEEGTAEIASEVSSRLAWAATGGPSTATKVGRQDFVNAGSFSPENWGTLLRLARMTNTVALQPNALTSNPSTAGDAHDFYGSAWHFLRFLGDAYGTPGGSIPDSAFFRAQNAPTSAPGSQFMESETGKSFETLLEEYALAVMGNGMGAGVEGVLQKRFRHYDFPTAAEIFCRPNPVGVYPWPVTTTGTRSQGQCSAGGFGEETFEETAGFSSRSFQGRIGRGGLRIHDFTSNGTGQGAEINVETFLPDLRLVVLRVR